jgi:hypothetical protein
LDKKSLINAIELAYLQEPKMIMNPRLLEKLNIRKEIKEINTNKWMYYWENGRRIFIEDECLINDPDFVSVKDKWKELGNGELIKSQYFIDGGDHEIHFYENGYIVLFTWRGENAIRYNEDLKKVII